MVITASAAAAPLPTMATPRVPCEPFMRIEAQRLRPLLEFLLPGQSVATDTLRGRLDRPVFVATISCESRFRFGPAPKRGPEFTLPGGKGDLPTGRARR